MEYTCVVALSTALQEFFLPRARAGAGDREAMESARAPLPSPARLPWPEDRVHAIPRPAESFTTASRSFHAFFGTYQGACAGASHVIANSA